MPFTTPVSISVPETITWLLALGRPPLPECPIEAAKVGKQAKAPCYFDGRRVIPVSWKEWQTQQPIDEILKTWFAHPKTGIGTLGGWNGKHWLCWIDFDVKNFSTQAECDRQLLEWEKAYPLLQGAPLFKTPSGGYRYLVAFESEPVFFKANSAFSINPAGTIHHGELLCKNGGHTLLPPTVGVNGKPYEWIRWSEYPPIVAAPSDIGLFPYQKTSLNGNGHHKNGNGNGNGNEYHDNDLGRFLAQDVYPYLTSDQIFTWEGHNFQESGGKLRGNCPWHESNSGTAFYAEQKGGTWLWRCPACNTGGGPLEYRYQLKGGQGTPRGKEFVDLAKEFAHLVGKGFPGGQKSSINMQFTTPDSSANSVKKTELQKESTAVILRRIDELINRNLPESELKVEFLNLAVLVSRSSSEIAKIYALRRREKEYSQDVKDDVVNLDKLTSLQSVSRAMDWENIFPAALYKGLKSKADASRIELIFLLQHLFPACGGLIGANLGILCKEGATVGDSWIEYPIIWSAIVAPPSSGKTDSERAIFTVLKDWQNDESKRYFESKKEWMQLEKAWNRKGKAEKDELSGSYEDPDHFAANEIKPRRKYLFSEGEIEAVKRRLSEQPQGAGVTWNAGEFLKIWNSLDQYKGGKGSARQFMLDAWSSPLKDDVERVDENNSFMFDSQTLSICGGIQPGPAAKFFNSQGDNADEDGLWSRMLLAIPEIHPYFDRWCEVRVSLNELLADLYGKLQRIPKGIVRLEKKAHRMWIKEWEKYRKGYKDNLNKNPAYSYFLGKMCSNLMRIALILQSIEHCFEPKINVHELSAETLKKAIRIANYYIAQFRLCQVSFTQSPEQGLSEFMMKILDYCLEEGKLTPSMVTRKWRRRGRFGKTKSMHASDVLEMFNAIALAKPELVHFDGKNLFGRKCDQVRSQCDHPDRIEKALQNGHSEVECDHVIAKMIHSDPIFEVKVDQNDHIMITSEAETTEYQGLDDAIAMITSDHIDHIFEAESDTLEIAIEEENAATEGGLEPEPTQNQAFSECDHFDHIDHTPDRIPELAPEKCDRGDHIGDQIDHIPDPPPNRNLQIKLPTPDQLKLGTRVLIHQFGQHNRRTGKVESMERLQDGTHQAMVRVDGGKGRTFVSVPGTQFERLEILPEDSGSSLRGKGFGRR